MSPEKIATIRLGATATCLVTGRAGYLLIDGGHRVRDRWFFTSRAMAAGIKMLIRAGANRIHPAHGQPFSASDWMNKGEGKPAGRVSQRCP